MGSLLSRKSNPPQNSDRQQVDKRCERRDMNERLFKACSSLKRDAFDKAKKIIEEGGADVNISFDTLALITELNFYTSVDSSITKSPFFAACQRGNLKLVKLLWASGARDEWALHAAAETNSQLKRREKEKLQVAKFLLRRGFSVRKKTPKKHATPLDVSVYNCWPEMAELLLANGARFEDCFQPPLLIVCHCMPRGSEEDEEEDDFYEEEDEEPVNEQEDLDEQGGLDDEQDGLDDGDEDIFYDDDDHHDDESSFEPIFGDWSRAADLVRLLLESGADPNVFKDRQGHERSRFYGSSIFEMAIRKGRDDVADLLLDHQRKILPNFDDE